MPQAKKNKDRKENLNAFKEKQKLKTKIMSEVQQQNAPQAAPVRQVPVWKSNEKLEILGVEFEAIYNYINSIQGAYAAVQGIMNRNILNGKVQIDFEKLNEDQTAYVPMSEEEKAPHVAEVTATLEVLRKQAAANNDPNLSPTIEDVSEPEQEQTERPKPSMIVVP